MYTDARWSLSHFIKSNADILSYLHSIPNLHANIHTYTNMRSFLSKNTSNNIGIYYFNRPTYIYRSILPKQLRIEKK